MGGFRRQKKRKRQRERGIKERAKGNNTSYTLSLKPQPQPPPRQPPGERDKTEIWGIREKRAKEKRVFENPNPVIQIAPRGLS